MTTADRVYSRLVTRSDDAEHELPEPVRRDLPRNGLRLVAANTLQSSGDQTVNASTVLPWLFHVLGVPAAFVECVSWMRVFRGQADRARARGWPVRELDTGHEAMVTAPKALADVLLELAAP